MTKDKLLYKCYLSLYNNKDLVTVKALLHDLHLGLVTNSKGGLSDYRELVDLLIRCPYPSIQLLLWEDEQNKEQSTADSKYETVIVKLCAAVIEQLLYKRDVVSSEQIITYLMFINCLPGKLYEKAYAALPEDVRGRKLPQICKYWNNYCDLIMLSRSDESWKKAITDLISYPALLQYKQEGDLLPIKSLILCQAFRNKEHFFSARLLNSMDTETLRCIGDWSLHNILLLCKCFNIILTGLEKPLNKFSNRGDLKFYLSTINLHHPSIGGEFFPSIMRAFQYIAQIMEYSSFWPQSGNPQKIGFSISDIISSAGVLDLVWQRQLPLTYLETRALIETYYTEQFEYNSEYAVLMKAREVETLDYYWCIRTVYEAVTKPLLSPANESQSNEVYETMAKSINAYLENIQDIEVICQLLEDILALLFLRWDQCLLPSKANHLANQDITQKPKSVIEVSSRPSGSSESNRDEKDSSSSKGTSKQSELPPANLNSSIKGSIKPLKRNGYLCDGPMLWHFCKVLDQFTYNITQEPYYPDLEGGIQHRFQAIINQIHDICWRYEMLITLQQGGQKQRCPPTMLYREGEQQLDKTRSGFSLEIKNLICQHLEVDKCQHFAESDCDEEVADNKGTDEGDNNDESNGEDSDSVHYSAATTSQKRRQRWTEHVGKSRRKIRKSILNESLNTLDNLCKDHVSNLNLMPDNRPSYAQDRERNYIYRILETPEELVVMALLQQKFSLAREIVQRFNLRRTHPQLVDDLMYAEEQLEMQKKLTAICEQCHRYQDEDEMKTMIRRSPQYQLIGMVKKYHNVASSGHSQSKLISFIEKFTNAHCPQQSQYIRDILQKYGQHSHWLCQFEQSNLNSLIICDLIWTLPLNCDDIKCVLEFIKEFQGCQHQLRMSIDSLASDIQGLQDKNSLVSQFLGPVPLLENFEACLSLLKHQQKFTINSITDLILNTTYTLRVKPLSRQLQREQIFDEMFYKRPNELITINQLQQVNDTCQELRPKYGYIDRFYTYILSLSKLRNHQEATMNLAHCQISDILQTDLYSIVGDLLFQCQMDPEDIEKCIHGMNVNLSHAIAITLQMDTINKINLNTMNSMQFLYAMPKQHDRYITYVKNQGNRLLAYLLRYICNRNPDLPVDGDYCNPSYLRQLIKLPEVKEFANFYGEHCLLAGLYSDHLEEHSTRNSTKSRNQLDVEERLLIQLKLKLAQLGVQESSEVRMKAIDNLIIELIKIDARHLHWMLRLNDITIRASLLYSHHQKFTDVNILKKLIMSTLQHREADKYIPKEMLRQLEDILTDVTICASVAEAMDISSWTSVYDLNFENALNIFRRLLNVGNYKLCNDWCLMVKLNEAYRGQWKEFVLILVAAIMEHSEGDDSLLNDVKSLIHTEVEEGETLSCQNTADLNYLLQLLNMYQTVECMIFLESEIERCPSMVLLNFLVKMLEQFIPVHLTGQEHVSHQQVISDFLNSKQSNIVRCYQLSLLIFQQIDSKLRKQYWHLMKSPLLIIEQLLMNSSFELLARVIQAVREDIEEPKNSHKCLSKCVFCSNKQGHGIVQNLMQSDLTYRSSRNQTGFSRALGSLQQAQDTPFILLNFNLYQPNHDITHDCIDLLLRIYASKSLEYQNPNADQQKLSQVSTMKREFAKASNDSISDGFKMPAKAPLRCEWTRNEDVQKCMCCRNAVFSVLNRRHHCRRCGRVVCYACSKNRMKIPEIYDEIEVRICNDCQRSIEMLQKTDDEVKMKHSSDLNLNNSETMMSIISDYANTCKWKLSGNISYDKLLREEFCYEHAPSVSLCLSILALHRNKERCYNLLLFQCRKLEKLLVPSPEVNCALIAKMIKCLAIAMKVYGEHPDVDDIKESAEIIISVSESGYESLIPANPLNNSNMRKMADALVKHQLWDLALSIHLKRGFPTVGVMAAHGVACLKAGCYETAREKFSHCMLRLSTKEQNASIVSFIFSAERKVNGVHRKGNTEGGGVFVKGMACVIIIRRPTQGPSLLQEIVRILCQSPCHQISNETQQRIDAVRNSATLSNGSQQSQHRYKTASPKLLGEPALNVLNALSNLKHIAKGEYASIIGSGGTSTHRRQLFLRNIAYKECLYYVLTYGSHVDIIQFLMDSHSDVVIALRYFVLQGMDGELFIHYIYLPMLRTGRVPELIEQVQEGFDNCWKLWGPTFMYTCSYLEKCGNYNALYQLQILLKDSIRAAITCIRFYTMNCRTYQQLKHNAQHLQNACRHLQNEYELNQWTKISMESKSRTTRTASLTNKVTIAAPSGTVLQDKKNSEAIESKPSVSTGTRRETENAGSDSSENSESLSESTNTSISETMENYEASGELSDPQSQQPLYFHMSSKLVQAHINTIWRQLEITKFLATCETKHRKPHDDILITEKVLNALNCSRGYTNQKETTLPTLFDDNQQKVNLTLLILLCGINIAEGFPMAYSIIKDYRLPKRIVFFEATRYLSLEQRIADCNDLIMYLRSEEDTRDDEINELLTAAQHYQRIAGN